MASHCETSTWPSSCPFAALIAWERLADTGVYVGLDFTEWACKAVDQGWSRIRNALSHLDVTEDSVLAALAPRHLASRPVRWMCLSAWSANRCLHSVLCLLAGAGNTLPGFHSPSRHASLAPVAFRVLHMLSALASPWHLTSGTITTRFSDSQTACALVVSVPHFSCRYYVYLSWFSTSTELYCVYDVALLLL